MRKYLNLVHDVYSLGSKKPDRTGTGTTSLFNQNISFDLAEGFPLVTTKKVFFKGVKTELLWFIQGGTNTKFLTDNGVKIWDAWAADNGDLGPVYGKQWRDWGGIDQLANVIDSIKNDPHSRRHIINAWNVTELSDMALPPCHVMYQFYVADGKLSCLVFQRSADLFLGLPFDIASYAILTHMIAQVCGLAVGELGITIGDAHIYNNHRTQIEKQLQRQPYELCQLNIDKTITDIDKFCIDDITIENYQSHAGITGKISV